MTKVSVEIDTTAIQKELNALSEELKYKAVRAGVAKVSGSGAKIMKQKVSVDRGEIKKSIRRRMISKSAKRRLGYGDNAVVQYVGSIIQVSKDDGGWIGNILEGGAKAHVIQPKTRMRRVDAFKQAQGMAHKKLAGGLSDGNTFFGKKVRHPGIRATHFVKRTDDKNNARAVGLFYAGVRDYLSRQSKKK